MSVQVLNGVIVESATRLDDLVRVSVPDLQTMARNTYGPLRFRPYISGNGAPKLPKRGDIAIIGIDSDNYEQWIISWHEDDHMDPPYLAGGGTGDKNYVHTQSVASATWTITHTLNKYPAVNVVNSGNNEVIPDIHYNSTTQITLTFGVPDTGKAYLN